MTRINHNTAVLAKEKGYNELHKHYSIVAGNSTGEINKGHFAIKNSDSDMMVTHPRQSELQKWLREEHNCIIEVTFYGDNITTVKDIKYEVEIDYYGKNFENIGDSSDYRSFAFNTYEDALEEGLLQSLNLIPAEIK